MKTFLAVLAVPMLSLATALAAAEPERVVFSENFSGCASPGVKTENGRGFMSGCGFDMNSAYFGSRQWGDTELRCSVRFPKKLPRHFSISVKIGGWREKINYTLYYITFAADGLSFNTQGLGKDVQDKKGNIKFKDIGFGGIKPDVWYRFIIRCEKDRLKISIGEEGGGLTQVCDAEVFPGGGGVAVFSNDRIQKVNENPFDIADVAVVELAPAPKPQTK